MSTKITIRLVPDGFFYDDTFVSLQSGAGYSRRLGDAILELREQRGIDTIDDALVSVSTPRVMLIPAREAYRADYLFGQTFMSVEGEEVMLQQSCSDNCILLYALSKEVLGFFSRTFDSVQYQHPFAPIVESALQVAAHQAVVRERDRHGEMLVACDQYFTDVCVAQAGQLQVATRFMASTPEDRLYYIMNVWQQLGMDQLQDRLRMVSVTPETKGLQTLLSKYVKNV